MRARPTAPRAAPHDERARGFVVLIVLVVLAILSAVVVAQFSVVTNNTIIGVRSADDAKARALAEGCLTMLQTYVDTDLGSPIPVGKDFDEVLNPDDSIVMNGDEFLPSARAGETVVVVPKGLTGSTDFVQRHKWLLIPQTVGSARGACLVRFDDNSDETLLPTALPTGVADDVGEGLLSGSTTDIPFKDRDRAIFLTAIGIFPFLPSTAAADAYGSAHARVTLRRLYNTSSTGNPTILAGGDVSGIKGALCSGGVGSISKTVGVFKSAGPATAGCACGTLIAETTPDAPGGGTCSVTPSCPCAPVNLGAAPFDTAGLATKLAALTPPGAWVTGDAQFVFANQSFGPAPAPGVAVAPAVDLGALDLGGGKASCKLHYAKTGEVFVWDRNDATNGCDAYTTNPVERPCTWDAANPGALVSCAAGQTRCWRRVFTGGAGPIDWKPTNPIPNVVGTRNWGAAPGVNYLCGDAALGNCSDCSVSASAPFAGKFSAGRWSFASTKDQDLPAPSYLVIENNSPSVVTQVNDPGNATSMLHASFVVSGDIDIDGDARVCGVGCDCSALGAPPSVTSCSLSDPDVVTVAGESCAAVRALGTCSTGSASTNALIVGDVRCGAIDDDKDNSCYIGNLAAMSVDPALACSNAAGGPCNGDSNFCWKQDGDVVGDVFAAKNIEILQPSSFTGTVASLGSFCSKQDVIVSGNLVLGLNAGFKGSSTIISGAGGISVTSLRAMVETAW